MAASQLDLSKPLLMTSFTDKWLCHSWTFRSLAVLLGDKQFSCRIAPKSCGQRMETQCSRQDVTINQFCDWMDGTADDSNPLRHVKREENSCYIDYKYMKDMFEDHPEIFEEVQWKDFGLIGFDGYDSTIWLSSEGANTPGHQDTYGFNLVTQICGRKLWILFPPEDSQYLLPTRVPYEESSIFSQVNIRRPDLHAHPKFKLSHPVVVTLSAGQTLYVPRHWWHYVESLEPSISTNVWVPMSEDRESHLSEAVTRCLATSLITSLDTSEDGDLQSAWLNPAESLAPCTINLQLLKTALCQLLGDISATDSLSNTDRKGSMVGLLAERLKGQLVINVDSPFQLDSRMMLPLKRKADLTQDSSPKMFKVDLFSSSESQKTAADLKVDLLIDTSCSKIFSLNPCSFYSYLKFLDNLCRQIHCKQCNISSGTDMDVQLNGRHSILAKTHKGSEVFNSTSPAGLQCKQNVDADYSSSICYSQNVYSPSIQSTADDTNTHRKPSADFSNKQISRSERNSSQVDKNIDLFSSKGAIRNSDLDSIQKGASDLSSASEGASKLSSTSEGASESCSASEETFSQLSHPEIAETLLSCTLHPEVIKLISRLFKEQCENKLKLRYVLN